MKIWKLIVTFVVLCVWYAVCWFAGSFVGSKIGTWLVKDVEA